MTEQRRPDIQECLQQLNTQLGPTLVAALSGAADKNQPKEWARGDEPLMTPEQVKRISLAHKVWTTLSEAESADVVRAWFTGANPVLGGRTPLTAIREDAHRDVLAAVSVQVTDSGGS